MGFSRRHTNWYRLAQTQRPYTCLHMHINLRENVLLAAGPPYKRTQSRHQSRDMHDGRNDSQ